jgi:hypothetical protein
MGVSPAVRCLLRMGSEMTEVWASAFVPWDDAFGMALVTFRGMFLSSLSSINERTQ